MSTERFKSNTVVSTIRTIAADRANLSKLRATEAVVDNLIIPDVPRVITVGQAPFLTIQSAIDSLAGLQARDTIIDVPAGVYDETLHLDHLSSSLRLNYDPVVGLQDVEARGLMLRGDQRPFVGVTYIGGGFNTASASHVWDDPDAPTIIVAYDPPLGTGYGQVQLNNMGGNTVQVLIISAPDSDHDDLIDLPGSIVQPDFVALGVVIGDRLILRDVSGQLYERLVTAVSGNQVSFDGTALTFANDTSSSLTFLPNVQILNTTAYTDTCVVSAANVTFKGIEFRIDSTGYNVRCNFLGSSMGSAQTPNCVFVDLFNRSESNVILTDSFTLFNTDRSQGRQLLTPGFSGLPVNYPFNNNSFMPLPYTIIGGGSNAVSGVASCCGIFGGSLQYGNLWIIQRDGDFRFGILTPDVGVPAYLNNYQCIGTFQGIFVRARVFYVRTVLGVYKSIIGVAAQFGGHVAKEFAQTKLTGIGVGAPAISLLNGKFSAPLQTISATEGVDVSDFGNFVVADDDSSCAFGSNETHNLANLLGSVMVARNGSRVDFGPNTTINIVNSFGALSRSFGHSTINLNQTNLTQQGIWVHTADAFVAESPEAQAFNSAAPITVTLQPNFATVGQLCFAGRIFSIYNMGPLAAHKLVLQTGTFQGAAGAVTTATLNAAAPGEGLLFMVLSSGVVQILGSFGVTFS